MADRSFYIDAFSDEVMPCDATLTGWAGWLSKPARDWGRRRAARDGETFTASAIAWEEDIVATRTNGRWSFSRDPQDGQFLAIRFGRGLGYSSEHIVQPDGEPTSDGWRDLETLKGALIRMLVSDDIDCEDIEYIACGRSEDGWRITFHAGTPARCTAERISNG
ncbi:MAG: hypothetical protein U5M50_02180 [Sphingobium sp.]|nr:hypothetical protein [Sphingobium sp.]